MEPLTAFAFDDDASAEEAALAEATCALALGRLDGLVAGLSGDEKTLFCMHLLRRALIAALLQSGFTDAEMRFEHWFAGLSRAPQETPLTPCPAHAIVRALLAELGHHTWEPLSEASQTISPAARFTSDGRDNDAAGLPAEALEAGHALIGECPLPSDACLPFAALEQLNRRLRQSALFAPVERGAAVLPLLDRDVAIERAGIRTPLWALDALLGRLLASCCTWRVPLPCPGAVTAEALGPQLGSCSRRIAMAERLAASVQGLIEVAETARRQAMRMHDSLGHLRSSARAPQVWMLLAGFAPLGLEQMGVAFGITRRGTYAVRDALVDAGMARVETVKGKVLLEATGEHEKASQMSSERSGALPSPLLAEFDAAMDEIDRLLDRTR
ncbi:hypothetical protein GCM10011349_13490 [Novosphingobium indicum]|uniref:MarR family transcriptional regulator n=1 Tax=Novosphingobium indicum TaxID=462949 RepID=A0ABQ2JF97_9SPHN|nr:hypothetical protein [Novosphingobium indicum]GGN46385.1 hypothetical protein GCM10011349_13490 [Novosphingobium indicum]